MADDAVGSDPGAPDLTVTAGGRGTPPTAEEMAAIIAAIEATWPRPGAGGDDGRPTPAWRFSGRWWRGSTPQRRSRPGRAWAFSGR